MTAKQLTVGNVFVGYGNDQESPLLVVNVNRDTHEVEVVGPTGAKQVLRTSLLLATYDRVSGRKEVQLRATIWEDEFSKAG